MLPQKREIIYQINNKKLKTEHLQLIGGGTDVVMKTFRLYCYIKIIWKYREFYAILVLSYSKLISKKENAVKNMVLVVLQGLLILKGVLSTQQYNNYPFMNQLPENQGVQGLEQKQNELQTQFPHYCQQMKKTQSLRDTQNDLSSKLQYLGKNSLVLEGQITPAYAEKTEGGINWAEKVLLEQINQQNLDHHKKSRSVFQNFQKHLITTLKISIYLQSNYKNDPTIHLAHRMWNIFVKTKYYSKKILHFLFGVKSEISPLLQPTVYPHFNCIAAVYPRQEIQMAQQYLREQVVRQGKKLSSCNIFENRRMRQGQEFQSYFFKFIEQLQNGGISRRLSKRLKSSCTNKPIQENI